jgi:hypothetical protein
MGTPAYRQNQRKNQGIYLGATRGRAIPHNKRRACLCKDSDTYSMDCCGGALIGQSIGQTQSAVVQRGAFSDGFSSGFDIGNI